MARSCRVSVTKQRKHLYHGIRDVMFPSRFRRVLPWAEGYGSDTAARVLSINGKHGSGH
jgi:hypothetical protein